MERYSPLHCRQRRRRKTLSSARAVTLLRLWCNSRAHEAPFLPEKILNPAKEVRRMTSVKRAPHGACRGVAKPALEMPPSRANSKIVQKRGVWRGLFRWKYLVCRVSQLAVVESELRSMHQIFFKLRGVHCYISTCV